MLFDKQSEKRKALCAYLKQIFHVVTFFLSSDAKFALDVIRPNYKISTQRWVNKSQYITIIIAQYVANVVLLSTVKALLSFQLILVSIVLGMPACQSRD